MDEAARRRLQWKCRRGLLELDLVLHAFLERSFDEEEARQLDGLLELQDNELWDIVSGRRDDFEARFAGVVARLRAT